MFGAQQYARLFDGIAGRPLTGIPPPHPYRISLISASTRSAQKAAPTLAEKLDGHGQMRTATDARQPGNRAGQAPRGTAPISGSMPSSVLSASASRRRPAAVQH